MLKKKLEVKCGIAHKIYFSYQRCSPPFRKIYWINRSRQINNLGLIPLAVDYHLQKTRK